MCCSLTNTVYGITSDDTSFDTTTINTDDTTISDTYSEEYSDTVYSEDVPDDQPIDPIPEEPIVEPVTEPPVIETTTETTTTTEPVQEVAFIYGVVNNEAQLISCKTPALSLIDVPEYIDGYPVTGISANTFAECYNAVQINIPYSVKTIDEGTFKMCNNLQYIGVATENKHYKSSNGVLYSYDGQSLLCYPAHKEDTSYTIADTTKYIGQGAFSNCTNLESVTLPSGIALIGQGAFNGSIALKEVTVMNNIELTLSMFENCPLETINGYENSKSQEFAQKYLLNFNSIGVMETTATTVSETSATTTIDTTTVDTTTVTQEAESLSLYAPERNSGTDTTEKVVMIIIAVALISLVIAIASKNHKPDDDDDDEDEDEDEEEDDSDDDEDEDEDIEEDEEDIDDEDDDEDDDE